MRTTAHVGAALTALVAVSLAAAATGQAAIPLEAQAGMLWARLPFGGTAEAAWPRAYEAIFFDIRMPRVALAGLAGAALAVAGVAYQGVFRNPLADPYLLGVASGAGLGAVIAFISPLPPVLYGVGIVQLAAFAAAVVTVTLVYGLARVGRTTPVTTLLLAGVAVGALAAAATSYLMYIHGDKLLVIYAWMLGGFNVTSWQQVFVTAPYVMAGTAIVLLHARLLNVLQLDEDQAHALGVDVERMKIVVVGAATLTTAAAVAVSGLIGFVGLVVPHVLRLIFGPDHRLLVPLAAVYGAAFLVAADAVARSLLPRSELPVGVITAACGAPFFLYLLRRQKRAVFW